MIDSIPTPTPSSDFQHGRMYSSESLDECLVTSPDNLHLYASSTELNGENISFLTRIITFRNICTHTFRSTCKSSHDFRQARRAMFHIGLNIFVTLVHPEKAAYPINISSAVFNRLETIFGPATAIIASEKKKHSPASSIASTVSSNVTPWDEPSSPASENCPTQAIPRHSPIHPLLRAEPRYMNPNNINKKETITSDITNTTNHNDAHNIAATASTPDPPWDEINVPADFDETVFDDAFSSVRYLVWTETWQRYCAWASRRVE